MKTTKVKVPNWPGVKVYESEEPPHLEVRRFEHPAAVRKPLDKDGAREEDGAPLDSI